MNKFNYVILLISVLILNACTQQNIRTQKDSTTEVSLVTDDNNTQDIDNKSKQEKENNTFPEKTKPKKNKELLKKVVEVELIKEAQEEPKEATNIIANVNIKKKKATFSNLSGKVSLNTDAVKDKDVEIKSTVVYFQPDDYSGKLLKNKNHLIASQNKRFVPSVLAIQKGSTVTFPNMDRILHNVFSVSNIQKFDLGLYSSGKEKTVTFDHAGIIYVHCNVHHSMQADILVLDTPFYTNVDETGHYSLKDLPNKSGQLYFWHPRAKLQKITLSESFEHKIINKTIQVVRKKIPLHTNKFGASYRPTRDKK